MSRIIILTAGYGEGHNAAARNLATALDAAAGAGTARVVDLFALASPRLNAIARRGYLTVINRLPRLWSAFYAWIDRTRPFPRHLWILRRERRLLAGMIQQEKPVLICSTYPVYAFLLEQLTETGTISAPYYNLVTDSISINSLWWLPRCHGWYLPNVESARVITAAGRSPTLLHTLGFPVQPFFAAQTGELQPPNLATGHNPRVLYIINSGSKHAETTARLLLAESNWEITCAVGRDQRLRARLQKLANRRRIPATILGWTDQIPQLLMTHHAVVSKAGGATTQEAIAARCPMIVNQIIPGQEEGNYELLRRHGIGALAPTPRAVVTVLRDGFAHGGNLWREWRHSLTQLTRPTAAADIARHLLTQGKCHLLGDPSPVATTDVTPRENLRLSKAMTPIK
ncbi:MAG: galactosyldiacylglycerol synthase [Cephaloticoccus sp.]|nr:galactosyldiacylglycerol synthase [Cephaloticoccus sp.]MCF7759322.1 galactosyldiacylglycerol synthase [Cephaloticoccus sp.]